MSSSRDRQLIEIWINADLAQPELLTGLEAWLQLGLIEHDQVKCLAQYRLSCPVPDPVVVPSNDFPESEQPTALPASSSSPSTQNQVEDFFSVAEQRVETFLSRAWNAFREELSVRWLLFLGVFAVLVASAGLAASQWQTFSAVAQYGVLLGYTIAFAGAGTWIARQPRSRLTAGALQTIAVLLVPINFWAMDALIAWANPVGWLMIGVATISLSGWRLWQTPQRLSFTVVFLGISYLHWGWQLATWPIIAIYLGVIATSAMIVFFSDREDNQNEFAISEVSVTVYALIMLLGRGILIADIPLTTLDLAIAISGWLLTLNQQRQASLISKGMAIMGITLLVVAWGLGVEKPFPWQAVVATVLVLEFFWQRLRNFWWHWDLIAMFGIGLQGWGLLWQLMPVTVRSQVVLIFEKGLGLENAPSWLLPTIGFFPYLMLFLGIAEWLYYVEKPKLAQLGEGLSLGLGAILTLLALPDPSTRSLILLLDTLTLIILVTRRSPTRFRLVYFTRIVAWLAAISSLDWSFNLGLRDWGTFFLLAMVGEWVVSTWPRTEINPSPKQVAYRSGWYLGFLFAGLSFVLLLGSRAGTFWGLLWLVTPMTLTIIRHYYEPEQKQTATVWAIATSFLAQGLTVSSLTPRIIGWSVATILLPINARYFPNSLVAMLPVGSALTLVASPFWHQLGWAGWSLWGAITLIIVWLVTDILNQRFERSAQLYASATYYWGIIIGMGVVAVMTGHRVLQPFDIPWPYPLAAGLSTIALGIRYWQTPTKLTGYAVIITMALTASESVYWAEGSQLPLAVVNLLLGCLTLAITSWLPPQKLTTSLQIAPLCFAVVGIMARLDHFTAYTGVMTLLAAVIGLFVGNRRQEWKNISYVSLLGIFLAIHELVIYQLWQIQAAISWTDQYSCLATVTLVLALLYQIGIRLLQRLQRDTLLGLHLEELQVTAHLHWGIGGVLEGIAALLAVETPGTIPLIGIANSVVLVGYALRQAYQKRNNHPIANLWMVAGWLSSELLITEIIQLTQGNWFTFATTHIILGCVALVITKLWHRQGNSFSRLAMIELLPLVWVSVGLVARYGQFTATTGGLVLASAITALGVGSRRQNWTIISRLALFAFSLGCYELLIYFMVHSNSSGTLADAFTLLAAVTAGIALLERMIVYWARSQETILGLPLSTLRTSAHLHWIGGSLLKITAIVLATNSDPQLAPLGIVVSIILATYAVIQGRDRASNSDWWVYLGLVQFIGIAVSSRLIWTELAIFDPWVAMMACLVGLTILQVPWQRWGWKAQPWYRIGSALPAMRVIFTAPEIAWFNLFLVAGFYGRVAWRQQQVRWSYGSLVLVAWGMAQLLARFQLDAPLWYALLVGLPILYIASVDPALRSSSRRGARNQLRLLGSSIIGFTALFYHPELGLAPLLIGLIFIFAGIALQVRAFLFVGTALLILTGIQQLYTFSQLYPFAKWVIGLVMGIVLIAIAASFESQRERILSRFQNWRERLKQWD